jgi:hypothetical protein
MDTMARSLAADLTARHARRAIGVSGGTERKKVTTFIERSEYKIKVKR